MSPGFVSGSLPRRARATQGAFRGVARRAAPAHFGRVKKLVVLYGLVGGLLIAALQAVEYRWLVLEHSVEIYGAIVATLFAGLGIWLGVRLNARRTVVVETVVERVIVREAAPPLPPTPESTAPSTVDSRPSTGLSPRELEILRLMALGLSNREIAERLFVSENTVKTHSSRLFDKLGARRRTQAVQIGRQHALIP